MNKWIKFIALQVMFFIFTTGLQADITGTVYKDFNLNGVIDDDNVTKDLGVEGLTVSALCEDGTTPSDTTDANGTYTLTVDTAGDICRVEVDPTSKGLYAGANAAGSATLVTMVTDGDVHNVSLSSVANYCQTKPDVIMAAMPGYFDHGDSTPYGYGSLFKVPLPDQGDYFGDDSLATKRTTLLDVDDTGSVWGITYKKDAKEIFLASNIKRNVPLKGEQDSPKSVNPGIIYKYDIASEALSVFTTIPDVVTSEANTSLNERIYDDSAAEDSDDYDQPTRAYVARQGLGDLDISEDGTTLYTINLLAKELVSIDATTGSIVSSVAIPNPYTSSECNDTMVRPWGIKVKGTDIYMGSVCEDNIENDVGAVVQKYDGSSFTTIAQTNTLLFLRPEAWNAKNDIEKGDAFQNHNWADGNGIAQPMLTDISFTNKGDLVLGYTSRGSYNQNTELMGDIRKMCLESNGTYTDESTPEAPTSCESHMQTYKDDGQEFYEFYTGEFHRDYYHQEAALGTIVQIPGMTSILVAMIDGSEVWQPGSVVLMGNTFDENRSVNKRGAQGTIHSDEVDDGGEREPFGAKAGGMGDIEILCEMPPIEVGNSVWSDENKDGIQNPGEPVMVGVEVNLTYNGTLIGSTTSDANGYYYFGGPNNVNLIDDNTIESGKEYNLSIALTEVGAKIPTTANVNANADDTIDNDAVLYDNSAVITFTTTTHNEHSLDFGFKYPATLVGHLYEDKDGDGIQNNSDENLSNITVTAVDALGVTHTTETNASGDYVFTMISLGDVTVDINESDDDFPSGAAQTEGTNPTTLTIVEGDNTEENNGFTTSHSVKGHLYDDANENNTQDVEESNLSGITVTITDANGTVHTVTTNTKGDFTAGGLALGDATVDISISEIGADTRQTEGDDPTTVTIEAGVNTEENNGFYIPSSVTGHLYNDTNRNGVQDDGESDMADITVTVTDSDGVEHNVETDENGDYLVTLLPAGSTTVDINQSDEDFPVGATQTEGTDSTTLTLGSGANTEENNGFNVPATLVGHVYKDIDADGTQNGSDSDWEDINVTVTDAGGTTYSVLTGADGNFTFTTLGTGDAKVEITRPTGYLQSEGTNPTTVTIETGTNTEENNGFYEAGILVGHIYDDLDSNGTQDAGENDLKDIKVTITDSDGVEHVVYTGTDGNFTATDLSLGDATVNIDTTATSMLNGSTQTEGTNPTTVADIASGRNEEENNGFHLLENLFTKKSTHINETLRAGDAIDYNITLANNSSSKLTHVNIADSIPEGTTYSDNGQITYWELSYDQLVIADKMTEDGDLDGYKKSDGTASWASDWTETNDDDDAEEGLIQMHSDDGASDEDALRFITEDEGDSLQRTMDLSEYAEASLTYKYRVDDHSSIDTDFILEIYDADDDTWTVLKAYVLNEEIAYTQEVDFNITNYMSSGTIIRFRVGSTNDNDYFYIDDVEITVKKAKYTSVTEAVDIVNDLANNSYTSYPGYDMNISFSVTVDSVSELLSADIVEINNTATLNADGIDERNATAIDELALLTGHLYKDIDGDGTKSAGDTPISDVTVNITDDADVTHSVVTDADGNYKLIGLAGGDASVNIDEDDTDFPEDVTQLEGTDPTTVSISAGSNFEENNGYIEDPGSLVGHLYKDTNGNGVQDSDEDNITAIDVIITESNGTVHTIETDSEGNFAIDNLRAGDTTVDINTSDEDFPEDVGQSEGTNPTTVTIHTGSNVEENNGFSSLASVTGHLYYDANGNSIQDNNEVNITDVDVIITEEDGTVHTVTTNSNGTYKLTSLATGDVTVDINESDPDFPAGAVQTEGTDPTTVTMVGGLNFEENNGYIVTGSLSGHLYEDLDANGTQDGSDTNMSGITVVVTDANGSVHTVETDANGDYVVTGLSIGDAEVDIDQSDDDFPEGTIQTEGTDSTTVAISSGDNFEENNGFFRQGSLTGHVYDDLDSSGTQDTGENNLSDIKVTIVDNQGRVSVVYTGVDGNFTATELALGDATVTIDTSSTSILNGSTQTEGSNPSTVDEVSTLNIVVGTNVEENNGFHLADNLFTKLSVTEHTPLRVNDRIDYNITLANNSSSNLTHVNIADAIPDGTTYSANGQITYWDVTYEDWVISDKMTEDGSIEGYKKSNGTASWASDWTEIDHANDNDEDNDANDGYVEMHSDSGASDDDALRFRTKYENNSIQRTMDLSEYSEASLTYKYRIDDRKTTDTDFILEIYDADDDTWTELKAYVLHEDVAYTQEIDFNITDYISSGTIIRFRVGNAHADDYFYLDDVSITLKKEINTQVTEDIDINQLSDTNYTSYSNRDINISFSVTVDDPATLTEISNTAVLNADGIDERNATVIDELAVLQGHLYEDKNGNGEEDGSDTAISAITVSITDGAGVTRTVETDGNGDYQLIGLAGGDATVDIDEDDTNFPNVNTQTEGSNPTTVSNIVAGLNVEENNGFHLLVVTDITSDTQTEGTGNNLVHTVTMSASANEDKIYTFTIENNTTDGEDDYNLTFVFSDGVVDNGDGTLTVPAGVDEFTVTVKVIDDETAEDNEFYTITVGTVSATGTILDDDKGAIHGHVFEDTNGDGTQQSDESNLSGVDVIITDSNDVVTTVTTDANGNYSATDLQKGDVTVDVDNSTVPTNLTKQTAGTDPQTVTVTSGGDTDAGDDGYQQPPASAVKAVIGNTVWYDENADGIQDAGESGIANVTVTLKDSDDVETVTTTDAEGGYLFNNLEAGTYSVTVTPPSGMDATYDEDTTLDNVTSVTVAEGEKHLSADFGYNWVIPDDTTNPSTDDTGAIGDRIWNDANGDGVQDAGESGIAGVTVTLMNDENSDGVYGGTGDTNATATTDAAGYYIFDGLSSAAYVLVVDSSTLPANFSTTPTGDPDGDGDNTSNPIVLASGDVYLNGDFGYHPSAGSTIGDTIYLDVDANGSQNGSEAGIAGVSVALLDDASHIVATMFTDANGNYLFVGLQAGDYSVRVTDSRAVVSDFNLTQDSSSTITVDGSANYLNQDFGYRLSNHTTGDGFIGDTVFLDRDGDDEVDAGEGLEGVTVKLYDAAGTTELYSTVTDVNGHYNFSGLSEDHNYTVKVDTTTLPNSGTDLSNSVDPDGNADSESFVILNASNSQIDLAQDFGYSTSTPNTLGGTLFKDSDTNGTLDATESERFENVTIVLLDDASHTVATTKTDASGDYSFAGLNDGSYTVYVSDELGVMTGYWSTHGANDGSNNNAQTTRYTVELTAEENNTTGDFGFYKEAGTLGDYVWEDADVDGTQGAEENAMADANVTLTITYPNNDTVTVKTVTDANGVYHFYNLMLDENFNSGSLPTYALTVSVPSTYEATLIEVGSNKEEDSNDPAGASAVVVRGAEGNSYDFGFYAIPDVIIGDVTVEEGDDLVFEVNLTSPSSQEINITLTTSDNTAKEGDDYTETTVTITIPAGSTTGSVTVPTIEDTTDESDENMTLSVSSTDGGSVGDTTDTGTGTILDDDGVTIESITSDSVREGTDLVHTVTMSASTDEDKIYSFTIDDDTTEGEDDYNLTYVFSDGVVDNGDDTITVPSGVDEFTVTVTSIDDTTDEDDEVYDINVGTVLATGTIEDNDDSPTVIKVTDDNVTEGEILEHNVTLSEVSEAVRTYCFKIENNTTEDDDYNASDDNITFSEGVTYDEDAGEITVPAGVLDFQVFVSSVQDDNTETYEEFYTICIGEVNATGTITQEEGEALPITISYVYATAYGDSVDVEFATESEMGNVGFNIYAVKDSRWIKLNAEIILGAIDSFEPQEYHENMNVPQGLKGYSIGIAGVNIEGSEERHGPFKLGHETGSKSVTEAIDWKKIRKEVALDRKMKTAMKKSMRVTGDIKLTKQSIQLDVPENAVYRLEHEELLTLGIDLKRVNGSDIAISFKGEGVERHIGNLDRKGKWTVGSWIEFKGTKVNNHDIRYVKTNTYELSIDEALAVECDEIEATSVQDKVFENNNRYSSSIPSQDNFYDALFLIKDEGEKSIVREFEIENLESRSAVSLTVHMATYAQAQYQVQLLINGEEVKTVQTQERKVWEIDVDIDDLSILNEGTNELEIIATGFETGYNIYYYNKLVVHYENKTPLASKMSAVSISDKIVKEDLAVAEGTNYVIISHPLFMNEMLNHYITQRQSEGWRVQLVNVEDIYQAYGNGMVTPAAIKAYLKDAAQRGVTHVQLVGAATLDYHDYLNKGAISFIPSIYMFTLPHLTHTPSDVAYVVDEEGNAQMAIGRWPVRSLDELEAIINKTLSWKSSGQAASHTALLIAGEKENGMYAKQMDSLAAKLEAIDWNNTKVYLDAFVKENNGNMTDAVEEAREAVLSSLDDGPSITTFSGHASSKKWAYDGLFKESDIDTLNNNEKPTIALPLSCYATYVDNTSRVTMSHKLLTQGEHGAVAVYGASFLSKYSQNSVIATNIMEYLLEGETLGEAVLHTKQHLGDRFKDAITNGNLLGDVTLRLE